MFSFKENSFLMVMTKTLNQKYKHSGFRLIYKFHHKVISIIACNRKFTPEIIEFCLLELLK
jgi:hypothetical protein